MTQTQEKVHRTVLATVQSRAEAADGYKLELLIPEFKSEYPTVVTRVPKVLALPLTVGGVYSLVMEQQRLKQGKTGERPYDYYWGLVGNAVLAPPTPPVGAAGAQRVSPTRDETRTSIERQKALDIAERFYSRFAAEVDLTVNEHSARLLNLAQRLHQWLETGVVPRIAPVPASASQEAIPEEDEPF